MWSSATRLVMLRTRRLSRYCGNCCHSCKIAVLNSSIFWHFGLRWLIFRPIKSHTCSIGLMSGDIAGHGIVWTASCCKKCCTIRPLCGLALSSMNIGMSANARLSKWGTTRGASTLSRYFWPVKNVQVQLTVKGKTTPDSYTPTPKSSCAQNVVVLKWSVSLAPNPCTTAGRA